MMIIKDVQNQISNANNGIIIERNFERLQQAGRVQAYLNKKITFSELNFYYQYYEKQSGLEPEKSTRHTKKHEIPADNRLLYLSDILALEATKEEAVINFRHDVLNDRLLKPNEIEAWIKDIAKKESGKGHLKITIAAPPDFNLTNAMEKSFALNGKFDFLSLSSDTLEYGIPDDEWARSVTVPLEGILRRLFNLSKQIVTKYSWQPAQATSFILTGITPALILASSEIARNIQIPAITKINMTLSPHLSPNQVANIYKKSRQKLIPNKIKRNRPMSEKHYKLAKFYYTHLHSNLKWADSMKLWAQQNPKDAYVIVQQFSRDAKHAYERVIGIK
jgi:hypothetical protein